MILRDYQQEAVEAPYTYYRSGKSGNILIVMPTASGKSHVIAGLIQSALKLDPNQRFVIATHVRELIAQDYQKLIAIWPNAPAGIYSAGLNKKDPWKSIVFGGIQSMYKKARQIGFRHLMIVDEAHLLNPQAEGMYMKFIQGLHEFNPRMKIIGLTATPFRLKGGHLLNGGIFTDIAYEIPISRLITKGYLSPLISKSSIVQADMSGVRMTAGEYNLKQAEAALDKDDLTQAALDEVGRYAADRKCFLFFCAGVDHAHHVDAALKARGWSSGVVHCGTPKEERDRLINNLKSGRIKALCNNAVLTTGTDIPAVDCIVLLRATASKGLYIQMLGRGMRLHPGKSNCLCLDFAGNVLQHGPVDAISTEYAKKQDSGKEGKALFKICPECRNPVHVSIRECICGYQWPEPERKQHDAQASDAAILLAEIKPEWHAVYEVAYSVHISRTSNLPTMKVDYRNAWGLSVAKEYICAYHGGYAAAKAKRWLDLRMPPGYAIPDKPQQLVMDCRAQAHTPHRIKVKPVGKFTEVLDHDFETRREGSSTVGSENSDDIRGDNGSLKIVPNLCALG